VFLIVCLITKTPKVAVCSSRKPRGKRNEGLMVMRPSVCYYDPVGQNEENRIKKMGSKYKTICLPLQSGQCS
jgi:hypothetical protein